MGCMGIQAGMWLDPTSQVLPGDKSGAQVHHLWSASKTTGLGRSWLMNKLE